MKHLKLYLNTIISISLIFPNFAFTQILADKNAPKSHQPTILKTPNNAIQIDITKPNNSGISINEYSKFNTPNSGVIFNNSKQTTITQTAGIINANPRLGKYSAKLIVNKVNSNDKSILTGNIEVAGNKADLIIANPSGIDINSAKFINSKSTTITTGELNFKNGNLNNIDVNKGEISINGSGIKDESSYLNIISNSTKINADIYANELNIITGANRVDTKANIKSINNQPNSKKTTNTPKFSIDSSALGGMYASKIRLVGTKDGVGVNNSGKIVAYNSIKISTNGDIINSDEIVSNTIDIKADNTINNKNIYANNNININSSNLQNSGKIVSKKDLFINTNTITNKNALIYAGENLAINANSFTNTNSADIFANNNIFLNTNLLSNLDSSNILSGGKLNIFYDKNINLNRANLKDYSGWINKDYASTSIDNLSSLIYSDDSMLINAKELNNRSLDELKVIKQSVKKRLSIPCEFKQGWRCSDTKIPLSITKETLAQIHNDIIKEYGENLNKDELNNALLDRLSTIDPNIYALKSYLNEYLPGENLKFIKHIQIDSNNLVAIVKKDKPHKKEELRVIQYELSKESIDKDSLAKFRNSNIISNKDINFIGTDILNDKSTIYANNNIYAYNVWLKNYGLELKHKFKTNGEYRWKHKSKSGNGGYTPTKEENFNEIGYMAIFGANGSIDGSFINIDNGRENINTPNGWLMEFIKTDEDALKNILNANNKTLQINAQINSIDTINPNYYYNAISKIPNFKDNTQYINNPYIYDTDSANHNFIHNKLSLILENAYQNLKNILFATNITPTSSIIYASKDISLDIDGNLNNYGDIISQNSINISANSILNSEANMATNGTISLNANQDISNLSSTINGAKIYLNANDIINKTLTGITSLNHSYGKESFTNIGKTSQILSNIGDIVLNANNNIYLVGSNLKSNANLILNAGNSILSDTIKDSARYDFTYSYGYDKGEYSFNKGSNLISQQNILLNANNNIALISTNLNATKKALLNAKNSIDISSSTNMDFRETLFKEKNPISKKSTTTTTYNQTINPSNIIANDIELNSNSITLTASNIQANNINITTNSLNLISDKNTNSFTEFTNKSGIITTTVQDKGKITQVEIPAIIRVNDKFILNGKDITNNLDTKTYNQISNKLNSQEFKENIIKELSSNSKTPLNDTTINQIKATLNSKEWNDKTTTLSATGALILTALITAATAGTGTMASPTLAGTTGMSVAQIATTTTTAATTMATMTASTMATMAAATTTTAITTAAIESATSAVISNLAVQSANIALSKGQIKFDLNSLVNSTVTSATGIMIGSLTNNLDILSGGINNNYLNINYNDIAKQTLNSFAKAGIQSGIYNTDFKDNLIANLTNQITDTLYNQVGHASSSLETINSNKYFQDGALGKVALHSITGGISSELMGDKFEVGALSAGLNEALSPLFSKDTSSMSKEELAKYNAQRLAISQLIGTISGSIIGGQDSANTAFTISTSAALNNRQMHQREIDWINANAEKFAKELYGDNPTQSQIYDAKARLAGEGIRKVDLMGFLALGEHDIVAHKFIKDNASSDLFIVKNEYEYKDATINLSNLSNKEFENLNNFYNQYLYTITSQNEQGFDFVGSKWQKYANGNFDNAVDNFSLTDTILNLPNSIVDFIVDIPDKAQSTITYAQSIFPTTTNDRLNQLYGDDGARTQANISTMDTIDILGLGIGVTELANLSKNAIKDRLAKSDTAVENTIKGADSAVNIVNYMKYKDELTKREMSSLFNKDGTLTNEALSQGKIIIQGENLGNKQLIQELTKDGSSITDWAKMKIDAENVEIHYYYNKTNNKVYYNMDYKTKFKGIK